MVPTPTVTQVYKDSHLGIPTKYQNLTGITILKPLGRFFGAIT